VADKPTALVTGASGLVGFAVAKRFLEAGYSVRALARSETRAAKLRAHSMEVTFGDITEPGSALEDALRGSRVVIHCAALHDTRLDDWARFERVNLQATKDLLALAEQVGVHSFLFTSSIKSIGRSTSGQPSDETVPYNVRGHDGHYGVSKALAEEHLLDYRGPVEVKLVNPAMVLGAPDDGPTPAGRLIRDFIRGQLPIYVDTPLNLVNLDDVAEAHLRVLERGGTQERYIVCAETMSMKAFLAKLATLTGRSPPRLRAPFPLLLLAAHANLRAHRTLGLPLALHPSSVKMARLGLEFDGTKITRELGLRYSPVDEGLRDVVRHFTSVCRNLESPAET
jgi:dihydroflavonol-4-reductase